MLIRDRNHHLDLEILVILMGVHDLTPFKKLIKVIGNKI